MQVRKVLPALLIMAVLLAACATLGTTTAPTLTPIQQAQKTATYFLHIYNAQYADTMHMALLPNLTDAQKQVVRQKKALLIKAKPLIDTFSAAIKAGSMPSADTEQQINDLINQLASMGG